MTADRPVGGTLMLRSDHDAEVARLEHRLRLVSDDRDQLAQQLGQAIAARDEAHATKNMPGEQPRPSITDTARAETTTDAAERLWQAIDDGLIEGRLTREDCTAIARLLTPARPETATVEVDDATYIEAERVVYVAHDAAARPPVTDTTKENS